MWCSGLVLVEECRYDAIAGLAWCWLACIVRDAVGDARVHNAWWRGIAGWNAGVWDEWLCWRRGEGEVLDDSIDSLVSISSWLWAVLRMLIKIAATAHLGVEHRAGRASRGALWRGLWWFSHLHDASLYHSQIEAGESK